MKKPNAGLLLLAILITGINSVLQAQNVSIAPSRLYYKVALGEYKSQVVNITNNSSVKQSFTVTFTDFEAPGAEGKSKFMEPGESENSCSKWMSATPSYFEIEAGQTQQVTVLLQVPNLPDANKVKWSAMRVKLAKEKQSASLSDPNAVGMGITETFQFVVHIFQSPPSVIYKNAEIESFKENTSATDSSRVLTLTVKNSGEAILDCASYLEITNLQTGDEKRLKPFAYTVLPGGTRNVKFNLPGLSKGNYSVLGVVDYGSKENVQAAELQIAVK
jgi:P pilus assembly chaperone PapD